MFISESEFNRGISAFVKGTDSAKLVTFPDTTRDACTGAFERNQFLKSAVLNEGLERLGECGDGKCGGVFSGTQIRKVALPSTLRVLGKEAFLGCKKLGRVVFREGSRLEEIGAKCFSGSGIEDIAIPPSVITICD